MCVWSEPRLMTLTFCDLGNISDGVRSAALPQVRSQLACPILERPRTSFIPLTAPSCRHTSQRDTCKPFSTRVPHSAASSPRRESWHSDSHPCPSNSKFPRPLAISCFDAPPCAVRHRWIISIPRHDCDGTRPPQGYDRTRPGPCTLAHSRFVCATPAASGGSCDLVLGVSYAIEPSTAAIHEQRYAGPRGT